MTNTRPFSEILDRINADPVRRGRIAIYKRATEDALALAELRAHQGATQQQMAGTLGGRLEVNVVFPNETVTLIAAKK